MTVTVSSWVILAIWQGVYPTIQAELFLASVRVSGIGVAHQIVIATLGGTAFAVERRQRPGHIGRHRHGGDCHLDLEHPLPGDVGMAHPVRHRWCPRHRRDVAALTADESPEFEAAVEDSAAEKKPETLRLRELLRRHPKALLQTAALSAPAVVYCTWAMFLPTYAHLTTGRDLDSALAGNAIGLGLLVIIAPLCGARATGFLRGDRGHRDHGAGTVAFITRPTSRSTEKAPRGVGDGTLL